MLTACSGTPEATPAGLRTFALLGTILALAACGISPSPSTSAQASATTEPASHPPAVPAVACAPMSKPFDPSAIDLTGAWAGDDNGIYYLRQLGSVVWWNGMSDRNRSPLELGREWNNVGRGVITGLQIAVDWSDVRGSDVGEGTLQLTIQDDGAGNTQIVTVNRTGGFGNNVWTPCQPVELQVVDYVGRYGGSVGRYLDILGLDACNKLADLDKTVTSTMNTQQAGSPEFRTSLGYSNAISDRELELNC